MWAYTTPTSTSGFTNVSGVYGLRCPTQIRPAARIAALTKFYSGGAALLGVPASASQLNAQWLNPVLVELQTNLGLNFDPVTAWLGKLDLIKGAHTDHTQQKWWSEALGRKKDVRAIGRCPGQGPGEATRTGNLIGDLIHECASLYNTSNRNPPRHLPSGFEVAFGKPPH